MTEVRTRDEAIASVDQALQVWSSDVTGIFAQAQNAAQVAEAKSKPSSGSMRTRSRPSTLSSPLQTTNVVASFKSSSSEPGIPWIRRGVRVHGFAKLARAS